MTDFSARQGQHDSFSTSDTFRPADPEQPTPVSAASASLLKGVEVSAAAITAAKHATGDGKRPEKRLDQSEAATDGSQQALAAADPVAPTGAAAAGTPVAAETSGPEGARTDKDAGSVSSPSLTMLALGGGAAALGTFAVIQDGGGEGEGRGRKPNNPPVAQPDTASAVENGAVVTGSVATNDSDKDKKDTLSFALNAPVAGLTLNANGTYSFDPSNAAYDALKPGQTQTIVANYTASDGRGGTATSTLTITLQGANDGPRATADSYSVNEDSTLVVAAAGVLGNDSDPEGDPITAVLVSGPSHGSLTLNANGSFSYTPTANYSGPDSFTYRPNDGSADGNTVTVSLTVNPVNDAPVAATDSYTTAEDTVLNVAAPGVLANDSDVDGNALSAVLVSGPSHGSLTLNANGSFSYTPSANYSGPDSFTYRPNDGTANGNIVTVNLTVTAVNDAPSGAADSYSLAEDSSLSVAAPGVLANDTDAEGNPLTAVLVTGPAHGSLTLNANGSFSYTPAANYSGPDSFTYRPNDGSSNGNPVTVSLTVTAVNDAPTSVADSYSTPEDTTLNVAGPGVLANDSDADGNPLTAVLVSGPAHGALTLNANGSFSYTPAADYVGPDSFTYRANDGTADGNIVTVSLNVTGVNDAPLGVADSYSINEDSTLSIAAPGVLANDSDSEGASLTAILVTGPAHGSLTLNADGSFSYTPAADYSGADSFTYKPNDGSSDGAPVTVSLTVNAVNDAPVALGDSYSTAEDTPLVVGAGTGVLANDTDADGNPLTAILVTGPAHASSFTLNADGSFSFTPSANYAGPDSFTYKVNDGTADGNIVTVNLTVNPVNDVPVAAADSYSVVQDTSLSVAGPGVLANDSDADGDTLSAALVAGVSHGSLTLNADGSFSYTPTAGYLGPDSFTYKVNDGTIDGNTVTVSLNVTSANTAPVAAADSYSTNEDVALTIAAPGVLANDTDADGNALTAALVSNVAHGTLILNADGSFTYTPSANYNGPDSFTYRANDGTANGNTVTVNLTVNPVNDAPVAAADSYSTAEDTPLVVAGPGVLANDSDAEGNALTAMLMTGPAHASSFTLNPDGSFSYTPVANYAGPDSFTYKANDGTADGNIVTVSLTVTPINDAPTSVADSYSVNEDSALAVTAPGVLANDSDVDGNPLTAELVAGPAHASSFTLNADGSFSYTPTANYSGADSFTYRSDDGTVDGNTVTVSLTVNPVNDPPVANDDAGTANEDSGLTVSAASGVLANDSDIDGGTLTVSAVTGGTVGSPFALASGALLTLNANGSYVYNTNGQFESLRPGQTANDSFSYTVSDGNGGTDTATVNITVQGANEVPVATADTYNGVTGNTPFTVAAAQGVLANDSDPDQPATGLSVTQVNGTGIGGGPVAVTGGTVSMNANGGFTFNPTAGFTGPATFTYTVTDADGGTDVETVTINVTGLVWYVNADYAGANGPSDGTYLRPFTQLTQLNGVTGDGTTNDDVDGAGDTIFVYNSAAALTGGITLEGNQKLYGDGQALTVNGIAIGNNAANSTINHSAYGVTLASGNEVRGINFNGTAGTAAAIQDGNASVGSLTIANVATSGQGQIVDIDQGGTLNLTLNSASSSGSSVNNGGVIDLTGVAGTFTISGATTINGTQAQTGIDLTGNTSLTAAFGGLVTVNTGAQQAVNLGVNTTSTTNFTAGLDIDTTSGTGLAGAAGNTLGISGGTNSINTTTGQILSLNGTALGASGATFSVLGASGVVANSAISLNNVDGAAFSGGAVTIGGTSGATSDGIFIGSGSTSTFSFASATIGATGDEGIEINGAGNGAVTFTTVAINGSGGNGVEINGATSSVAINGGTIGNTDDPAGDAVNITGGSAAVTIAATLAKTSAGNVVEINNHDSGNISFSANISATGTNSSGILVTGSNGGTIAFTGQTINLSTGTGNGVDLTGTSGATINFNPAAGGNGLDIVTTSGTGFNANGGGTINVSGAGNTIAASAGRAVDIDNATVGMTWASLSSTGATEGIGLTNLLAGSSFNGGNVTISNRTGTGIFVDTVQGTLTFGTVNISNPANTGGGHGIRIEDSSAAVAIAAANISNANQTVATVDSNNDGVPDTDGDGDAIFLKNNTGSFTLTGGLIQNSDGDGIDIRGATNVAISNVTIDGVGLAIGSTGNVGGIGGHGIYALNMTGTNTITNTTITNWESTGTNGLRWWVNSGTGTLTIHGSTFSNSGETYNGTGPVPSAAIVYRGDGNSNTSLIVGGPNAGDANSFLNILGEAINHAAGNSAGSTATANITIQNNLFQGTAAAGGQNTVSARNVEGGKANILITGNTFENVGNTAADTSGVIDVGGDGTLAGNAVSITVTNNVIHNIGSTSLTPGGLPQDGKRGIDVFIDDNSNVVGTILISGNTISDVRRTGIILDVASAYNGPDIDAQITNNIVGTDAERVGTGTALGVSGESGIRVENRNANGHNLNVLISGNQIRNSSGVSSGSLNTAGLFLRAQDTATLDATVLNNNIETSAASAQEIRADTNFSASGTARLSIDVSGNVLAAGSGTIALNEIQGILQVEQASAAALASANGIPSGNVTVSGSPAFGVPNQAAPMLLALHSAQALPGDILNPPVSVTARHATGPSEALAQSDATILLAAAIERWLLAGATGEQLAAMQATTLVIADMAGNQLGSSGAGWIQLDDDGAGHGWFVDPTPSDDAEFARHGASLDAIRGGAADGRVDLLTVLMHELGHQAGLTDQHAALPTAGVMSASLLPGERLLPDAAASGHAGEPHGHAQGWIEAIAPLIEHHDRGWSFDTLLSTLGGQSHASRDLPGFAGGLHNFDIGAEQFERVGGHDFGGAPFEHRPFEAIEHRVL